MKYPMNLPEVLEAIRNYAPADAGLKAAIEPAQSTNVPLESVYAAFDGLKDYPAGAPDPATLDDAGVQVLAGCAMLIHQFGLTSRAAGSLAVFMSVASRLPEKLPEEDLEGDAEDRTVKPPEGEVAADA